MVEEDGVDNGAKEPGKTGRDTPPETKVEGDVGSKPGSMGTGGAVTNATPGATSSGTNSPRR